MKKVLLSALMLGFFATGVVFAGNEGGDKCAKNKKECTKSEKSCCAKKDTKEAKACCKKEAKAACCAKKDEVKS